MTTPALPAWVKTIGILDLLAIGAWATDSWLETEPKTAAMFLSATAALAWLAAVWIFPVVSCFSKLSLELPRKFDELISSIATSYPLFAASPANAAGPVSGLVETTLIVLGKPPEPPLPPLPLLLLPQAAT